MKKNKKKKLLFIASVLSLIALGAGTFAWFTSKDDVTNHFEGELAGNDIQIVETYEPENNWKPGQEVNKDVAISNVSEYKVLTRISFEEILKKLKDVSELRYDGTEYTDREGNIKTDAPVNPVIVPSKANYEDQGFKDVTANLKTPVTSITLGADTMYEFKLFEKKTKDAVTAPDGTVSSAEYTYVAQWEDAKGNKAKAYIGNTSNQIIRDENDKLSFKNIKPTLCVVDKTYSDALQGNWTTSPIYSKSPINDATFVSMVDDNIQLNLVSDNISKVPTKNKWFFNKEDGYFYYCGQLDSGENTVQLLDSVTLLGTADSSYGLLDYDLKVKAEGIQAAKKAVEDTWTTATGELKTLLESLCEF